MMVAKEPALPRGDPLRLEVHKNEGFSNIYEECSQ